MEEGREEKRGEERGYSGLLRRKTGQTEAGWVEGSINSFAAGAPTLKSAAEDPPNIVNLVIACCVSPQENLRRSPKGFVRNGREREARSRRGTQPKSGDWT